MTSNFDQSIGHWSADELQTVEDMVVPYGLEVTAYNLQGIKQEMYPGLESFYESDETQELSWVNVHSPDQDPLTGNYEFNGSTLDEIQYKFGNWSEWHEPLELPDIEI